MVASLWKRFCLSFSFSSILGIAFFTTVHQVSLRSSLHNSLQLFACLLAFFPASYCYPILDYHCNLAGLTSNRRAQSQSGCHKTSPLNVRINTASVFLSCGSGQTATPPLPSRFTRQTAVEACLVTSLDLSVSALVQTSRIRNVLARAPN